MKDLNTPEGYTTKEDFTGDCYECAFCAILGEGEHEELNCTHPTPRNTGCADHDLVFVKIVEVS